MTLQEVHFYFMVRLRIYISYISEHQSNKRLKISIVEVFNSHYRVCIYISKFEMFYVIINIL